MKIKKEFFGKSGEQKGIYLFTLENDKGTQIKITNFGACVTSILTADKKGNFGDIVLGFDNIEQYEGDNPYFGVTCGRYANRIGNAKFAINGKEYHVIANDGKNSLHGGLKGLHKVVWMAGPFENKDEVGVKLVYLSPDMDEGYPGNFLVEVNYILNNKNELIILYSATTDKATVLNLTNHSYFNLNCAKKEIYEHHLTINSEKVTAVDSGLIPTGVYNNVEGTGLDFRTSARIGDMIKKVENGFDHNFVLHKNNISELSVAAKVVDPESGRIMEVYTTEPGIQFYSGNHLNGVPGKYGLKYNKHYALCLETQHFPDSPNHKDFPTTLLQPGETYTQKTIYKFGIEK
jgi:aldose 1-epimerase